MRKKLTIYHADGSEEIILSRTYAPGDFNTGGITGIGYAIYDENNAQIIVQPTLHRKVKIEEIQ